jgi:hypothetical protein
MAFKIRASMFVVGLTVIAVLPSVPAPFAALSLDATLGACLYVGAVVVLAIGYARAEMRENAATERGAATRQEEVRSLLHRIVELESSGSAKHDTTHTLVMSLYESIQRKAVILGGASSTVSAPSISGTGHVTAPPGTGALQTEGFAPEVSVEELDQEIREKEATVLRHLVLHADPGQFTFTGYPLRDESGVLLPDPDVLPPPSDSDHSKS